MKKTVSQPFEWQPPPPEIPPTPPLRTTASHFFFTHHMNATSRPPGTIAPASKVVPPFQPKAAHANIAAVTPELAQAGLALSAATTSDSHAAQLDVDNHEVSSNSPTACFLGIPTEAHCMIYEYLWTPTINIYIMSPSLSPPQFNAIHPIFNVNRQIRSEAIDSLKRNKSITFAFHASTDDADFRKMAAVLEDLNITSNYFKDGGKKMLQVHLHLNFRDAYRTSLAPGGFAEYVACLAKLGLEAEYEYTFTDRDGYMRGADFARLMVVNRLLRLIHTPHVLSHLDGATVAVHKMQFLE